MSSQLIRRSLLLLFILGGCSCRAVEDNGCLFDAGLSGEWFQSGRGNRLPVTVNRTHFLNGRCIEVGKANRFLIYLPQEKCHKCMVINRKHHNIIQYKESFCDQTSISLKLACHGITGDATLFTMFRLNTHPVKCPFAGPLTFTYSKGYGECIDPVSQVDSCVDDSRLLFHQRACADVPKSESKEEELLCLAVWKDGSNRYLAGKINHIHANNDEDRYRCFIYERPHQSHFRPFPQPMENSSELWHLSMSADATCQGLVSANEGSITMKLNKAPHAGKRCKFPAWFVEHKEWQTLDFNKSYYLYHRNTSLKISNSTTAPQNFDVRGHADLRLICHEYRSYHDTNEEHNVHMGKKAHHDHADFVTVVVHYSEGCRSGYKCMRLYRRDTHAIQVQYGQEALTPDEACKPFYWNPAESTYVTLLSRRQESVSCGPLGKYRISDLDNDPACNSISQTPSISMLTLGCSTYDTLELYSQCPQEAVETYQCHSQWESNQVIYIIASPHSRASGAPKRVCFSYRINNGDYPESADVIFSTRHDTCISRLHDAHLAVNATLVGQCAQASGISSGSSSQARHLYGIMGWLFPAIVIILNFILRTVCDVIPARDQILR